MNEKQLERSIQSIGKGCFIKYFDYFENMSISNDELIDLLMKNENYKESGAKTRTYQSRRIINSGYAKEALKNISESQRLDEQIREQSIEILESITKI